MNRRSKFCDQCGAELPGGDQWPKICPKEHRWVFPNPTPIAVALIPVCHVVNEQPVYGCLIGLRENEPMRGQFALIGGFQDDKPEGETTRQAARREVKEETGLILDEEKLIHFHEYANPAQSQVLHFYRYDAALKLGEEVHQGPIKVCPETSFLDVAWHPTTLAFSSHTEALAKWFAEGHHLTLNKV